MLTSRLQFGLFMNPLEESRPMGTGYEEKPFSAFSYLADRLMNI